MNDTESPQNRGSDKLSTSHEVEASLRQLGIVETEKSEAESSRRWKLKATAGVLALAAVVVSGKYVFDRGMDYARERASKKVNLYQANEISWIEKARQAKINEAASVMVLHAGVVYRDTPASINDSSFHGIPKTIGNVAGTVPKGTEITVTKAIWKFDNTGTWLGFTFDHSASLDTSPSPHNSAEVADKYYWVNYGQLKGATKPNGNSLITSYPVLDVTGNKTTTMGTMDQAGNMIDATSGKQAAYGIRVPAGETATFLDMFGVTTDSHPGTVPSE